MDESTHPALADERLRRLIHRKSRTFMTWDQLLEEKLPIDMGARETWDYLQTLFRCLGVEVPLAAGEIQGGWFYPTVQIIQAVGEIGRECGPDSFIANVLGQSSGRHFLTNMRIEDAIAAAVLDGFDFDPDNVMLTLRHNTEAKTPLEQLLKNVLEIDEMVPSLSREPLDASMVDYLIKTLARNVPLDELQVSSRNDVGIAVSGTYSPGEFETTHLLETIVDYWNKTIGSTSDAAIFRIFTTSEFIQYTKPFGSLSIQANRLILKLLAAKSNVPVLAALPLTKTRLEWENGLITPPDVICPRTELDPTRSRIIEGGHVDLTLTHTILTQLTLLTARRAKETMLVWKEQDEKIKELLKGDAELNHRQRTIIARAIRSPEATFRIRYHQHNHAVTYATARQDLMDLVDCGYLTMDIEGRAYVFRPAGDLASKLTSGDRLRTH